ncbi:hypothetical protein CN286_27365 [Bacillus anthracis]|nr:hypothetical protein CN286_27365 [Bacillus anthracis]
MDKTNCLLYKGNTTLTEIVCNLKLKKQYEQSYKCYLEMKENIIKKSTHISMLFDKKGSFQ